MPRLKMFCLIMCLMFSIVPSAFTQNSGMMRGTGESVGNTEALALEAAKLDAINDLILNVLKRDTVFRDLFVPEAFKNDWFVGAESYMTEDGLWAASISINVDEGFIEALSLGRYSTTVGALLDQAERAIMEVETALAEAGRKESNGDLGGSETAYRQAEAKTTEALRYIGPVNDAVYFSSIGNRKAPELKSLLEAYSETAKAGVMRIEEGRDRLSLDQDYRNAIDFLGTVEVELVNIEAAISDLRSISTSPPSYETERLRTESEIGRVQRESLKRHRLLVIQERKKLDPSMEYPALRAGMVLDKIDSLSRLIDAARSAVGKELFNRSAFAQSSLWALNHEPKEYLNIALFSPFCFRLDSGDVETAAIPVRWEARAEGAVSIGKGGVWGRTRLVSDEEPLLVAANVLAARQDLELGFFNGVLIGGGLSWDWFRNSTEGNKLPSIMSVHILLGAAGQALGTDRILPLWTLALAWELPRGDSFILARDLNLKLESVIRPSHWVMINTELASRARESGDGSLVWVGNIRQGFGFRLPFLKPLLWRFDWEGGLYNPLVEGQFSDAGRTKSQFRFGIEYSF